MDLNLASGSSSSSSSSIPVDQLAAAQMHNFMPMPPPFINRHHHPSSPTYLPPHPHPISHGEVEVKDMQSQLLQTERHIMQLFWNQRLFEVSNDSGLRSHHELPLARIKKIMKADEEVKMVSGETPVLFSKACELFIMELTLRSWLRTEDSKRRTLQRCDIERAIRQHDVLDFLLDSFPPLRHHLQECSMGNQDNSGECLVGTSMSSAQVESASDSVAAKEFS